MAELKIVGTSHIAEESIEKIDEAIEEFEPDIIAVELDIERLNSLMNQDEGSKMRFSDIPRAGITGYLFSKLGGYIQKKLGNAVGVKPGEDMRHAAEVAHSNNLKLILIDRDIRITMRRFSDLITIKEIFRFVTDIIKGVFRGRKELERFGIEKPSDLKKIPSEEIVRKMTDELKRRYPNVHKVLVKERNEYMARRIKRVNEENIGSRILAVVGAGHVEGLRKALKQ